MAKEVIISTSRLNCYGFRVLTEGIDTEQYSKNPVLLWMHNRPMRGTVDEVLPIGRMENLRVEGDKLIGTPVFDMSDPFAKRIADKWEQGILKMASAGLEVLEESNAPEHIVEGQRYSTVTRSKLVEVSIVDIGANDDALALYRDDKLVDLKEESEITKTLAALLAGRGEPPLVRKGEPLLVKNEVEPKNSMPMKEIALKLGLPENATQEQIVAAIGGLQEENKTLKAEKEAAGVKSIELAVDQAVSAGKIAADKKQHFVELGKKAGLESLTETLKLMSGPVRPTDVLHQTTPASDGGYKKLSEVPVSELAKLRKEQPMEYRKLYKAEYGVEPEMND